MASLEERLYSRIMPEPNSGCWLWLGALSNKGYGNISANGRQFRVHRVVYEMMKGPIPEGLVIDHKCRIPSCVNPDHLMPGSSHDNHMDMVQRGRALTGERNPGAKLSAEDVRRVREMRARGFKLADIAAEFSVSFQLVSLIANNKIWKEQQL